jgi:hypothetical protein
MARVYNCGTSTLFISDNSLGHAKKENWRRERVNCELESVVIGQDLCSFRISQ